VQTEWTETGGLRWPELWPWRNMGGMKIKVKLKVNCEGACRITQIQGTWLFRGLNFERGAKYFQDNFWSPFPLQTKLCYRFAHRAQASADSQFHTSLQNCGSSVCSLIYVTIRPPRIWRCRRDFFKTLYCTHWVQVKGH